MYAIGGWFDTSPNTESVGFLFEGRTTANTPGSVLAELGAYYPGDNAGPFHNFAGVIDPDGFNSVVITGTLAINEEGMLEGGAGVFGSDDYTFAMGIPEPASLALLGVGGLSLLGIRRRCGLRSASLSAQAGSHWTVMNR